MKKEIAGNEVDLTFSDDGLLCWPTEWSEELRAHGFIEAAAQILVAMPACAVRTPWIIGSGTRSISGQLRSESRSHMEGKAFDMSPMFSADEVLSPDGQLMGLAWNVVSLDIINKAYAAYPHFVVEGDHLHVQPEAELPVDVMLAAFTMPSWYEWTDTVRSDAYASPLDGSFWLWIPGEAVLRLATADESSQFLSALRV